MPETDPRHGNARRKKAFRHHLERRRERLIDFVDSSYRDGCERGLAALERL